MGREAAADASISPPGAPGAAEPPPPLLLLPPLLRPSGRWVSCPWSPGTRAAALHPRAPGLASGSARGVPHPRGSHSPSRSAALGTGAGGRGGAGGWGLLSPAPPPPTGFSAELSLAAGQSLSAATSSSGWAEGVPRRGAPALLCAPRSPSGAERGWGREASTPAFPTPDPGLRLRPRPKRCPGLGGAGAGAVAAGGDQAEASSERAPPTSFTEGGLSALCAALPRAEEGSWLGGGRYKYLQIVSSGTGGGEGSARLCAWGAELGRRKKRCLRCSYPWWPEV
jgi:hypothetical protein